MARKNTIGSALIVASIMLAVAVLGSGYFLSQSIQRGTQELRKLSVAIADVPTVAGARANTPSRPGRPDPSRRYDVNITGAPSRGAKQAQVTVVEFSDFQCPFCGRVNPTLERINKEYRDEVLIVFKHLPLSIHAKAPAAHAAAEAAHRQGQFWEMHDRIFEAQRDMSPAKYREYAREMDLDMAKYDRDLASAEVKARVDADTREAAKLGVTGTPSFFVNGRFLSGAQPFESFKRVIDEELKEGFKEGLKEG
ncbi:MAG: thioredoxin domain-containing protein [Deltaproteobacteria bacterium]|nr:thioredoxin domain-containing protein [Deltaproteobacteria bacterium]